MAATINTNIASINAQRNLSLSGQSLNTTMQRLSSGLRVNSAKDDAAGLAIAERMNTQVKGLTVASRNANDGISLAQTAEGALGKVGDMLQRMRELAVQASNATNSASDRKALQAEVAQLGAEIDRVAKQTNFNGQKILDGSFAGAVFQVGANSGDNVTLGALADTRANQISNISYATNVVKQETGDVPHPAIEDFDLEIPAGTLKIQVGEFTTSLEKIEPANSSLERLGQVITAINNKTADTGVTAYMTLKEGTQEYSIEFMNSKLDENLEPLPVTFKGFSSATTGLEGVPMINADAATAVDTASKALTTAEAALTGYPTTTTSTAAQVAENKKFDDALTAFDEEFSQLLAQNPALKNAGIQWETQLTAYKAALAADPRLPVPIEIAARQLSALFHDGTNPIEQISELNTVAEAKAAFDASAKSPTDITTYTTALEAYEAAGSGFTPPVPASSFTVLPTAPTAAELETALQEIVQYETDIGVFKGGLNTNSAQNNLNDRGVDDIDVTTQSGAWIALKKIDSAIDQVNSARATLGAMQTRFENAVNNIDIQVENLSAARGRIMDADFAVETANLSRTQILQQAGTAMVAQANQIPQNVLQLLQG